MGACEPALKKCSSEKLLRAQIAHMLKKKKRKKKYCEKQEIIELAAVACGALTFNSERMVN